MPSAQTVSWRIKPVLPIAKFVAAGALAGLAYAFGRHDPVRWGLVAVVVLAVTGWAVRDLVVPVRLAADASGVTVVVGLARRRHLPWSRIERIRVDSRSRRGLRTQLLEIDAGEDLVLLGAYDLGASPDDVAAALASLWASGPHAS